MGVRIGSSALAAACARSGAIGCISSVGLGSLEGSQTDYIRESSKSLKIEIQKTRQLAPNGVIAVNVMVALSNYNEIIKACVE